MIIFCFDYWNDYPKEIQLISSKYPDVCTYLLTLMKFMLTFRNLLIFFWKILNLKDKNIGIFIDNTFTSAQSCDLSSLKKTIIVRKLFLLDCFVSNFKMFPSTYLHSQPHFICIWNKRFAFYGHVKYQYQPNWHWNEVIQLSCRNKPTVFSVFQT